MFNFIVKTNQELSSQKRLFLIGLGLMIGIVYDLFVYKQHLGIGFFVFVNLSVLLFLVATIVLKQFRQPLALLFLLPIVGLSLSIIFYNNDLVTHFVPFVLFIFCLLFFILSTLYNDNRYKFKLTNIPIIRSIDLPFLKWGQAYRDIYTHSKTNSSYYKKILIGILIGLPILIIFKILFYYADQIFANFLDHIIDYLPKEFPWRIIRTLVITLFATGFFYVLFDYKTNSLLEYKVKDHKSDKVIVSTILILINILFISFVFIQIKYLFGSANYVFGSNYTFAEYARKGFFELSAVLGIVAFILLLIYRSFCKQNFSKLISRLQVLLIVQTGIIGVSALKRMNLYQDIFGYTVKRLYVEWFIYFVLAILLLAAIGLIINLSFRKLLYSIFVLGMAAFAIVSLINVDRIIAKENIDRYLNQNKDLDLNYLLKLSVDSRIELIRILTTNKSDDNLKAYKSRILIDIKDKNTLTADNWRSFNYSRHNTIIYFYSNDDLYNLYLQQLKDITLYNKFIGKSSYFSNRYNINTCYNYNTTLVYELPSIIYNDIQSNDLVQSECVSMLDNDKLYSFIIKEIKLDTRALVYNHGSTENKTV